MPDPTPDPVTAAWNAVNATDDLVAAQRALLAEWLARHDETRHPAAKPEYVATHCGECARAGMPACQLAERTRRLGVEGEG